MAFELPFKQKAVYTGSALKTFKVDITCGVPQGSIDICIYVNDLCNVSKIFVESAIFADDRNLFFSHKSIKELFHTVNL